MILTGLDSWDNCFIPQQGAQIGTVAHPASHSANKAHKVDHKPQPSAAVNNEWSYYPHSRIRPRGLHRNSSTLYAAPMFQMCQESKGLWLVKKVQAFYMTRSPLEFDTTI
jgi:hypothetical protein